MIKTLIPIPAVTTAIRNAEEDRLLREKRLSPLCYVRPFSSKNFQE
jgi:hypothetical protein